MELSSTSKSQSLTEFDFTPEQSLFVKNKSRYSGYVSGVGAGKTFGGIGRTLRNMTEWNPGEMGAIVAPTKTMVVDVIINEMRDLGLFDRGFEYKSAHTEEPGIHGPNGSRALVLSADNKRTVERLKGLNLAWWWIDEEAEVPPRAREILMQRLRTGNYRNGFITTTPKGKNHTWEFFVRDVETDTYDYGSGTVFESPDTLAITGVPTWANPHTPDDYHEDMEDLPEEIRQQEVEGLFVEIGGGVFQREMFNWKNYEEIRGTLSPIIGVDPAATADSQAAEDRDADYWGVTIGYPRPREGELYIAESVQKRGMTLREGIQFIKQVAAQTEEPPKLVVEANAAQQYLVDELVAEGMDVTPVNTSTNKEDKIIDLSIPIANGTVKFIDWGDDTFQELHQQMLAWPESNHDDMIDSLALVVNNSDVHTSQSIFGGSYGERDLW
jgi:predicted phage terminase large subunit-like protein